MFRSTLSGAAIITLLASALAFTLVPGTTGAQQPESEQSFNLRMANRIDTLQERINSLKQELDEDAAPGDRPSAGGSGINSGIRKQLQDMDDQCRSLEREVSSIGGVGFGTPSEVYQRQRYIVYSVEGMERQLSRIRRWLRQSQEPEDASADAQAEPAPEDDGISDEEWAQEWAKGGK